MKNRVWSILLCLGLCLSLLPGAAWAKAVTSQTSRDTRGACATTGKESTGLRLLDDDSSIIGDNVSTGDSITVGDKNYTYGGDASGGLKLDGSVTETTCYKAGKGYALFTPAGADSAATLTLHDAALTGTIDSEITLNLVLEGANTITVNKDGNTHAYGIYTNQALTISGSGSLDISASSSDGIAAAIFVLNPLTIQSGTVISDTAGIVIGASGSLDIQSSATVNIPYVVTHGQISTGTYTGPVIRVEQATSTDAN
jgi:hypothetical protein